RPRGRLRASRRTWAAPAPAAAARSADPVRSASVCPSEPRPEAERTSSGGASPSPPLRSRSIDGTMRSSAMVKARLHGEPEVDDVAVLDDVVLALEPELPRLAAPGLAPEAHELLVGDHLGADEAALDVAVDLARRLEGGRSA